MMLPPYAETLGLYVDPDCADGCRLIMPYAEGVLGRPGFLHGGAISGLMEMAAIVALRRALADDGAKGRLGGRIKPINVTVDFMRGGRDKLTYSTGLVTRLGNRVANVEATAWQDDATKPIAAARMNYLVVRG